MNKFNKEAVENMDTVFVIVSLKVLQNYYRIMHGHEKISVNQL